MIDKLVKAIEAHVKYLNSLGYDETFEDVCNAIIDTLEKEED